MKIKKLFHHKKQEKPEPQPLRIPGVGNAPMTPEPDDAELAAQALLEIMNERRKHHNHKARKAHADDNATTDGKDVPHDAAFYRRLAENIRIAYAANAQRATRFISFCEQQLRNPDLPLTGEGSVQLLEAELYKRIDIVEREGGKLKQRWQHCLAEVTLRLLSEEGRVKREEGRKTVG